MKTFFRIKWEVVMVIILTTPTIMSWYLYIQEIHDGRSLAIACICTFVLLINIIGMKSIANVRHEILKNWE